MRENCKSKGIIISNHAIVRYYERVLKVKFPKYLTDYEKISYLDQSAVNMLKKNILDIEKKEVINVLGGRCKIHPHQYKKIEFVIDEYVLKTIINKTRR